MEIIYREREGGESYVESYKKVRPSDFSAKEAELVSGGYTEIARNYLGNVESIVFCRGEELALLTYFPNAKELRLVTEPDSGYVTYLKEKDEQLSYQGPTKLTHVDTDDPGISTVIRLPDGRFIVFDGGWENNQDAHQLMDVLRAQNPYERPVIAAWIMTHPHIDHYRAYFDFDSAYRDEVEIQRFIFNFPDPALDERIPRLAHANEYLNIGRFYDRVSAIDAKVIRAHTGQVFEFSGVRLEIISSPDDVYVIPIKDFNKQSLIVKIYAEGQTILHGGDAHFGSTNIAGRYGEHLKSDILYIPHHFFDGGNIAAYDCVHPEVLIIPTPEVLAFEFISMWRNHYRNISEHLIYHLGVKECFTNGMGNITLTLPYTCREGARERFLARVEEHKRSVGAKSWYFDGMTKETAEFTFINAIWDTTEVSVDLLFEDSKCDVFDIKITLPAKSFKKLNVITDESVNPENSIMNKESLKKLGVPEGAEFVVHIRADKPIVVAGKKPAAYHS